MFGRLLGMAPLPPPASDPIAIFGSAIQVWYRSDLGIVLNGSTVSQWVDQSGNNDPARTLANPTATQQPIYIASDPAFGGKPSLQFDSVDDWLYTGSYLGGGAYTAFEVCSGLAAADRYFWMRGNGTDYLRGDAGTYYPSIWADQRGGTGRSTWDHTNSTWGTFAGVKTLRVEMNGTHVGHKGFLNNGPNEFTVSVIANDPGTLQLSGKTMLGANFYGASNAGNRVAEFLVVTGVDATKNQQCEQYLRARYGHY
jgi:hypothetical protein